MSGARSRIRPASVAIQTDFSLQTLFRSESDRIALLMTDGVTLSTPIKLPVRACALFGDVHVGILGEMKEAELQANELVHAPIKLSAPLSLFPFCCRP